MAEIVFEVRRRVPEGANCPECASYHVEIIALPAGRVEDLALKFDCHACGHSFRLEGVLANTAIAMLRVREGRHS